MSTERSGRRKRKRKLKKRMFKSRKKKPQICFFIHISDELFLPNPEEKEKLIKLKTEKRLLTFNVFRQLNLSLQGVSLLHVVHTFFFQPFDRRSDTLFFMKGNNLRKKVFKRLKPANQKD